MIGRILQESEYPAWDDWLRTVDGANLRQTSIYRAGLMLYGYRSEILVLEESSRFVAGALLRIKSPLSIGAPLVSYFEGNEASRSVDLVERMRRGEDVAVISEERSP